jgi:PAS domain S-box-containing protein
MIRLREVVALSSDAAFAVNRRCHVAAWNERAEQMLGYMRTEVLGRPCRDILQAVLPNGEPLCAPRCEPFRCFRNCLPRGIGACRVRRKDGDWHTVGYSSLVASPKKAPPRKDSVLAVVLLHNQGSCDEVADREQTLRVSTLGRFALTMAGEGVAIDRWARKQSITLLKFLVTQVGRPVHRERILDCLWPATDTRRGWNRLKVTISYLRQQLRSLGLEGDVLQTVGKAYLLRRDAIRVDAEVFENLIAEGHALQSRNRVNRALRRCNPGTGLTGRSAVSARRTACTGAIISKKKPLPTGAQKSASGCANSTWSCWTTWFSAMRIPATTAKPCV